MLLRSAYLVCVLTCLSALLGAQSSDQKKESLQTVADKVAGMQKLDGFFPLYWDEKAGKIWLEIDKLDTEFLYVNSLSAGIGSNDIGLDRGQLGDDRIVKFHRIGPKVLLIQPNYGFRALSDNPYERRAAEEAFAQSTLWGFEVAAVEGARVLVDATDFFLRDAHGVAERLKLRQQGEYSLDLNRAAIYLPRTKNFSKNTEVEALLTFAGKESGSWVRQVAPTATDITVRQHHSLLELPKESCVPREFDPRGGYGGISYMDFAAPIGEPVRKRYIARHELKKKDPSKAVSEPVEPIVYYLDRGAPEPIRSALLEGARWWAEAFEAAGFRNAFKVELLPEGADPLDVRYNVIQWVHRSTRGWSYGSSVRDPRTGQILKGHVTLGSLRVRQDYLIAEGLLAPYEGGKPTSPEMRAMALARLRQLSAHEVGHTLGLSHNYIASTSDRASVMDYPHPLVRLNEAGEIDLSEAYDTGVGEWDVTAIKFGYSEFAKGVDEKAALAEILRDAARRGIIFLSDQDARPSGSAHPETHLWDNGTSAAAELRRLMKVRQAALDRFGERNIPEGTPYAQLESVLVPLYLLPRYQIEAATKVVGGLRYTYAVRGDGQPVTEMVPGDEQRAALAALLQTLSPAALTLLERILRILPPPSFRAERGREEFASRTSPAFDALAPAETLADNVLSVLLQAPRAARLVQHHARNPSLPSLGEVIEGVLEKTWHSKPLTGLQAEVQRTVQDLVLRHLMRLGLEEDAPTQVRAIVRRKLDQLPARIDEARDEMWAAHLAFAKQKIRQFLEDPSKLDLPTAIRTPDGAPIGTWTGFTRGGLGCKRVW